MANITAIPHLIFRRMWEHNTNANISAFRPVVNLSACRNRDKCSLVVYCFVTHSAVVNKVIPLAASVSSLQIS